MIPWRPIAELPDELKDGREVLLALESSSTVAWWNGSLECWTDIGLAGLAGLEGMEPTHFAEINAP